MFQKTFFHLALVRIFLKQKLHKAFFPMIFLAIVGNGLVSMEVDGNLLKSCSHQQSRNFKMMSSSNMIYKVVSQQKQGRYTGFSECSKTNGIQSITGLSVTYSYSDENRIPDNGFCSYAVFFQHRITVFGKYGVIQ